MLWADIIDFRIVKRIKMTHIRNDILLVGDKRSEPGLDLIPHFLRWVFFFNVQQSI